MLTRFAVKNFRGFAERIEWNLSHPSNYSFNTYAIKDGVVKNGIIYGPNGSGKTTITSKILRHEWIEDAVYINPDQVAQDNFH